MGSGDRGRSIGNYMLSKTIGEGTFGKVKLGVHLLTGEKVAVKVLEKDRITDKGDVKRVTREIQILKHIQHPHVINLLEVIEKPKHIYLVTEYVGGGELFEFIVAHGRLQETQACRIFRQVVVAVDACHALGVAHRDLKPENMLIDDECNVKLIDFGLSNTFESPSALLRTACGSPCYAAPEMIAGKRYLGAVADIWSLGVCLFAMLCGYLPFEDPDTPVLYKKILAGSYAVADHVSTDARDLLAGLLTIDPAKRFTVREIYQHPWFVRRCVEPLVPPLSLHPENLPAMTSTPVEPLVLAQLEAMGMSRDYCVQCLAERKRNHTTAAYFLLRTRHLRTMPPSAAGAASAISSAVALPTGATPDVGPAQDALFQRVAAPPPPAAQGPRVPQPPAAPQPPQPPQPPRRDGGPAGHAEDSTRTHATPRSVDPMSAAAGTKPAPPAPQPPLVPRPPSRPATSTGAPRGRPTHRYKVATPQVEVGPAAGVGTQAAASFATAGFGQGFAGREQKTGEQSFRQTEIAAYGSRLAPPGAGRAASARRQTPGAGGTAMPAQSARRPMTSAAKRGQYGVSVSQGGRSARATMQSTSGRGAGPGHPGVSTMSAPATLPPRELMARAARVAGGQRDMLVTITSPFMARCEKHGLEFLMEVAATDATQSRFVIRLQLCRGEATFFREVAARILPNIKLTE